MTMMLGSIFCLANPATKAGELHPKTTPAASQSDQLNWVRKGTLATRGTTQHNLTLAKNISTSGTATAPAANSPATVLRWRTPEVAQSRLHSQGTTPTTHIVTVSGIQDRESHVRQAAVTDMDLPAAIPDAFEDPFGDGSRSPKQAPAPLQVAPAAQLVAEPAPAPLNADGAWQDDPPPQPLPSPPGFPSAGEPDRSSASEQSCDRIYNRRDCCADEELCNDARSFWDRDAIAKISLDITPSLRPDETDPYVEEAERNKDLAKAPPRTWHDREGRALATGRLTNIKRGRLLILDADNQIIKLPFDDLCDDDLCFLTAWWRVPTECTFGDEQYLGRNWAPSTLTWKASALCHKPLFFEEVQLERYGHSAGPLKQPFLSGAHFFLNLVTIPYQAGINPPWECRYSLGYYRPGSCAPWLVPPVPLSVRGALLEAGVIVGGVALFP